VNIEAYVITLERSVHRRAQVERLVATCPLRCRVAAAVDGATLTAQELQSVYRRRLHRPYYPLALRLGEIGCFLSHRRLWQRIVDDGMDAALILEDDVELKMPDFGGSLDYAKKSIPAGGYIQFQVREIGSRHPVVQTDGRHAIVAPRVTPLRTSAQLVTRQAAERLLAASQTFDRPIDAFLQMTWLTNVPLTVVLPSHVAEISQQLGGSTIGAGRKPLLARIHREIVRPVYRARIARLSRRAARPAA